MDSLSLNLIGITILVIILEIIAVMFMLRKKPSSTPPSSSPGVCKPYTVKGALTTCTQNQATNGMYPIATKCSISETKIGWHNCSNIPATCLANGDWSTVQSCTAYPACIAGSTVPIPSGCMCNPSQVVNPNICYGSSYCDNTTGICMV